MRHHLFLHLFHLFRYLRIRLTSELLHKIKSCQMKLWILNPYLPFRKHIVTWTDNQLRQLNSNFIRRSFSNLNAVHTCWKQAVIECQELLLIYLCNLHRDIFCTKLLCCLLRIFFCIIHQNLIIVRLRITYHVRHPGTIRHNHIHCF